MHATRQTSEQWYMEEYTDHPRSILDPDGWRDIGSLSQQVDYWYTKLITRAEFEARLKRSTLTPKPPRRHPYAFVVHHN